jgi:NAD(P)-dependent dehydrogenase (short-subunit alcohol dehydrogenase family)
VDVTSEEEAEVMARKTCEVFGKIDILINNAGIYPKTPFDQITYTEWKGVLAINLDSVFLCSRAVLPHMKQRGSGKIINIATNGVWVGDPEKVHYIAAKSGVVGFTRALARDAGAFGITVNAVAPGAVVPANIRLAKGVRRKLEGMLDFQCLKRLTTPEDLVGTVQFLASSDSDFITGQVFTVDGGLTNH